MTTAKKSPDLLAQVQRLVASYSARKTDFEDARDLLHKLPPEAMRHVLELATAPKAEGRDLLVMALSDVIYPPALPFFRVWIGDEDDENIAMPAISALDRAAGGKFRSDRMWSAFGLVADLRAQIAAWWDAGVDLPSLDEGPWLARQHASRDKDKKDVPPPSPALSAADNQRLHADLVALKQAVDALDPRAAWAIDLAAIRRALPIYDRFAADGHILRDALAAAELALAGTPFARSHSEPVTDALRRADKAAGYSKAHGRYRDPAARAAAHVCQGVLYALSSSRANRLQGMHYARNAIEYAGGGYTAVRAELDWQLAQVRASR